jgi:hypothetical protein
VTDLRWWVSDVVSLGWRVPLLAALPNQRGVLRWQEKLCSGWGPWRSVPFYWGRRDSRLISRRGSVGRWVPTTLRRRVAAGLLLEPWLGRWVAGRLLLEPLLRRVAARLLLEPWLRRVACLALRRKVALGWRVLASLRWRLLVRTLTLLVVLSMSRSPGTAERTSTFFHSRVCTAVHIVVAFQRCVHIAIVWYVHVRWC